MAEFRPIMELITALRDWKRAYCWLSEAGGTGYFMAVLIRVSFRDVVMA
jgi:hypothetical protein